jgi:threonine/homoserine/homoserine lactone efflux protein
MGKAAALGIAAGCLAHILAAALGLSALLAASQTAFTVLKWVGAAYLVYIAIGLFREPRPSADTDAAPALTAQKAFRSAALVNLLNPKVGLFFLAFLPQFIDPANGSPALQVLVLGMWFNISGTAVNAVVALAAARAAAQLRGHPWFARLARWFAGTLIAGLAAQLALSRAR